jgi:hypothetical protein
MEVDVCEIKARVLFVSYFHDFLGDSIRTHVDPKFVVGLILEDCDSPFKGEGSSIHFPVHTVAVFAIQSVVKLFFDRDVVNNVYSLQIKRLDVDGQEFHMLSMA